jgi:hypothetical protein
MALAAFVFIQHQALLLNEWFFRIWPSSSTHIDHIKYTVTQIDNIKYCNSPHVSTLVSRMMCLLPILLFSFVQISCDWYCSLKSFSIIVHSDAHVLPIRLHTHYTLGFLNTRFQRSYQSVYILAFLPVAFSPIVFILRFKITSDYSSSDEVQVVL